MDFLFCVSADIIKEYSLNNFTDKIYVGGISPYVEKTHGGKINNH